MFVKFASHYVRIEIILEQWDTENAFFLRMRKRRAGDTSSGRVIAAGVREASARDREIA